MEDYGMTPRQIEGRNVETSDMSASQIDTMLEVHEVTMARLEGQVADRLRYFEQINDQNPQTDVTKAQKVIDLDEARKRLEEAVTAANKYAREVRSDTRDLTTNPNSRPMRLTDEEALVANARLPLVNAEAAELDLDDIYIHLENTIQHGERGLMYCWILAAERRIAEEKEDKGYKSPQDQRDLSDLQALVRRSRERLADKRNDATRERAASLSLRASSLGRKTDRAMQQHKLHGVNQKPITQYSFVGKRDKLLPPADR